MLFTHLFAFGAMSGQSLRATPRVRANGRATGRRTRTGWTAADSIGDDSAPASPSPRRVKASDYGLLILNGPSHQHSPAVPPFAQNCPFGLTVCWLSWAAGRAFWRLAEGTRKPEPADCDVARSGRRACGPKRPLPRAELQSPLVQLRIPFRKHS